MKIKPIHPGQILLEEFLEPMGISQYRLAKDLNVPLSRIAAIVKEERSITADTALRLARYFGVSKYFWIGLQKRYELDVAEDMLGKAINDEVYPLAPNDPFNDENDNQEAMTK